MPVIIFCDRMTKSRARRFFQSPFTTQQPEKSSLLTSTFQLYDLTQSPHIVSSFLQSYSRAVSTELIHDSHGQYALILSWLFDSGRRCKRMHSGGCSIVFDVSIGQWPSVRNEGMAHTGSRYTSTKWDGAGFNVILIK